MIRLARKLEKEYNLKGRDLSQKQGTPKYDVRNLNPEFKEIFGFVTEKNYDMSEEVVYSSDPLSGDIEATKLPVYVLTFDTEEAASLFALKWL